MSVETRPPRPRTGPPGPVLSVRDLHVHLHRGGRAAAALRGVSLDVAPGEIVALVGESGSGKSTLGFAVQGLLAADSSPHVTGSISVDGTELVGAPPAVVRAVRRRSVRAVFQDPMSSLNPTMRIGRQIDEASTPGPGGTSAQEWLERVGVPAPHERVRAFPHQLSGGQRQRVMIAMAMAAGPSLVIADEPTTALDVTVQAQILRLFRELRDTSGTAFVFVTHDLSVAASIADRIVVLYAGRIVEQGPIRAVASAPAHPYTAGLLSARFDLDADKDRPLSTLPGEPPRATDDVRGCPFTNRCPLAVEACDEAPPPLLAVAQHPGTAACIRTDLVTPALWTAGTGTW
ncbi:MAG TPA: ABC transporter ATP-binding protein, partial [Kineosporiaceae bacterium]|nr:ABC transporter ATP-binding protein [Kineosporiaceae bacterium]